MSVVGTTKNIIVTGATSGFGYSIAQKFLQNGWNVIATGRRSDRLDTLRKNEKDGSKLLTLTFDVRDNNQVNKV